MGTADWLVIYGTFVRYCCIPHMTMVPRIAANCCELTFVRWASVSPMRLLHRTTGDSSHNTCQTQRVPRRTVERSARLLCGDGDCQTSARSGRPCVTDPIEEVGH